MATFIPEWIKVQGTGIQVKRVLNALDDEHVVRRGIRPAPCPANLFVQHGTKGWLAVAIEDAAFDELHSAQLFDSPSRTKFEQQLADLQRLGTFDSSRQRLEAIVIMGACSDDEVRVLSKDYLVRFGVRLIARERFARLGAKLISGLLAPISEEQERRLLMTYFPETEVAAACTTRRFFRRDNSAKLERYFLDHHQEWATKLDLELPAEQSHTAADFSVRLVNGVAGSGKTLIALHRARLLAELFPAQRVLLLIHNTPIVADINDRLHRVRAGNLANLEISTFFAWIYRQWRLVFRARPQVPEGPRTVDRLVEQNRSRCIGGLPLSIKQLVDELDFINDSLILDEAEYLQASRVGRGFGLRPQERRRLWALYRAVTDGLHATRCRMWSALPKEICLAGERLAALAKYHHVLVDEAQFFAPSWFEAIKLSLAPGGQLFLCADPNQGFMKRRLSWKSVGLDVAGKTKRLRRSYRTTRAILQAANGVLAGLDSSDPDDFLQPDFSCMPAGLKPVLIYTGSTQDSMDRLANELSAVFADADLPLNTALVIYGDNVPKLALHRQLQKRFGEGRVWWFNEKHQKKAPPGGLGHDCLRMVYLETATGLEAPLVFLIGIERLWAALQQAERREENARKLYMAMTRAGQRLVVLSTQRLVPAMERLFSVVGE